MEHGKIRVFWQNNHPPAVTDPSRHRRRLGTAAELPITAVFLPSIHNLCFLLKQDFSLVQLMLLATGCGESPIVREIFFIFACSLRRTQRGMRSLFNSGPRYMIPIIGVISFMPVIDSDQGMREKIRHGHP